MGKRDIGTEIIPHFRTRQELKYQLTHKDNDIGVEQLFSALKTAGHGMGISGLHPSCWPRQGLHFLAPRVKL